MAKYKGDIFMGNFRSAAAVCCSFALAGCAVPSIVDQDHSLANAALTGGDAVYNACMSSPESRIFPDIQRGCLEYMYLVKANSPSISLGDYVVKVCNPVRNALGGDESQPCASAREAAWQIDRAKHGFNR
jgi:hypothetical protein